MVDDEEHRERTKYYHFEGEFPFPRRLNIKVLPKFTSFLCLLVLGSASKSVDACSTTHLSRDEYFCRIFKICLKQGKTISLNKLQTRPAKALSDLSYKSFTLFHMQKLFLISEEYTISPVSSSSSVRLLDESLTALQCLVPHCSHSPTLSHLHHSLLNSLSHSSKSEMLHGHADEI